MSEVSVSAQQLAQALAQLNKASSSNPLARQGVEVLVKQVTAQTVFLADPRNQRSYQVPASQLRGKLLEGSVYQARVSNTQQTSLLNFLSSDTNSTDLTRLTTLSPSNLTRLLQHLDTKSPLLPIAQNTGNAAIVKGTVTAVLANQVKVQFQVNGIAQQVTLNLPNARQQLSQGQVVNLALQATKSGWDVALLAGKAPQTKPTTIETTPAQTQQLVKAAAQEPANTRLSFSLTSQALIQAAKQIPSLLSNDMIGKLLSMPAQQVVLEKQGQQWQLNVPERTVAASLPLDKKTVQELKNLGVELTQADKSNSRQNTQHIQPSSSPQAGRFVSASPSDATQMKSSIEQLLRRLEPQQFSPSQSANRLVDMLKPLAGSGEPGVKAMVEGILKDLNAADGQKSPMDNKQIQQLFAHPTQPLTTSALTSPPPQGLIGGLIAMLQVSLASRLLSQQPQMSERIQQLVTQIISTRTGQSAPATNRAAQDIGQQDQRGGMLRELLNMLSNHQTSKLTSAEQALQGQDTFYYLIPSAFGDAARDIELLIRREPEKHAQDKKASTKQRSWHLTMKLSVGEHGEMLTKARLTDTQLEIDFYTSGDSLKLLILEHLPALKKRFSALGIELGQTQCQLGKIPDTLKERPYRIFETQA